MKPLSTMGYIKNNKKKFISSSFAIVVAVIFLYVMQCFCLSMKETSYALNVTALKNQSFILNTDQHKISSDIISKVKSMEHIKKLIPTQFHDVEFVTPGSYSGAPVLKLRDNDMNFFLQENNIKLLEGRLPHSGNAEIALDYKVARNKKLKLGDKIGDAVDKNEWLHGEFTIVGIIKGESFFSLMSYSQDALKSNNGSVKNEDELLSDSFLVYPEKGFEKTIDEKISKLRGDSFSTLTLTKEEKSFEKGLSSLQIMDMISILSIFAMVVSLVCSKYAQFYNRKAEFGILDAFGYNLTDIMKKVLQEVSVINFLGFATGIVLAIPIAKVITYEAYSAVGGVGIFISLKAFIIALLPTLFTTLFTFIPVIRMISTLDPISMIEKK